MIIGVGIDIVDNDRIEKILKKYGTRFKKKCFSEREIKKSDAKINPYYSYAKRYAAKEACAKAMGTGLARGVKWKDIEVHNNIYGKPYITLHKKAENIINKLSKNNFNIVVSLSDVAKYSIANVIIYKK